MTGNKLKHLSRKELLELVLTQDQNDGHPDTNEVKAELKRLDFKTRYLKLLRSTVYALIVTAAAAVLIATLVLPVLQIYGTSMTPTLNGGDIVVSVKTENIRRGDIIGFYYSNKILVKRVIGLPLDTVELKGNGDFYVNGELLDEPYISDKLFGECDIEFPFSVPEGSYFVVGDHRETSVDSRSSAIGCVPRDEIVGKILFCVFPFKNFGKIK